MKFTKVSDLGEVFPQLEKMILYWILTPEGSYLSISYFNRVSIKAMILESDSSFDSVELLTETSAFSGFS